ncbi:MAG TPA: 3TM-type holin [Bacillota bacterium]|nr:3TM-type holin [Bacillota bacterium]
MSWIEQITNGTIGKIVDTVDKHLPLSPETRAALEKDLQMALYDFMKSFYDSSKSVIIAEAQGNWLQRSWRPLLMLTIISILFNNHVLAPYLCDFFPKIFHPHELPERLYTLMEIGVGGYMVLRTSEKTSGTIVDTVKNVILPKKQP